MSTQIDLGPVLPIPKGVWDADTTYERLNIVRHNSASWICNVATSTGVEPTEDSTDWCLQVKDTSSVSSVNGMKGDVVISTIATPDSASNDTSITNTEWVRDRIDEASDSTQSYTDDAISTATTSILNTAAQDASNKATTAVNQALASSAAKFATISTVDSLTNRVDTLEERNTEQDTAITAAQSRANAAQNTANTAVTNASAAQDSADAAQAAADTAQSTANTALNNAATAQSTANTANDTANTANSTANAANGAKVQVGTVIAFASNSAPSGYVLCNGAAVSRTTYAALFAKIGTTYGTGNGSTTFNLPNLTDKFIQGSGTAGSVKAAGLPNITGSLDTGCQLGFNDSPTVAGALAAIRKNATMHSAGGGSSATRFTGLSFNAKSSNAIYGASSTVQPPALTMRFYIKY